MHITFVKKILANGEPCQKCRDVESRLQEAGYMARIDQTLIADERDRGSPGLALAEELGVDRAPFFVVTANGERKVYTVYFKFVREVLDAPVSEQAAAREGHAPIRTSSGGSCRGLGPRNREGAGILGIC